MKTYKLLQLLLVTCVFWSCSQDTIDSPNADNPDDGLAMNQYDNSYLGVYKGLFSTDEGFSRGSVNITLLPNKIGEAAITLNTGEQIVLTSAIVNLSANNTVSNLRFSTEGNGAALSSFEFSVNADGQNPLVSNVSVDSKASNILIAKNTQRLPLTPITGTYDCTNCNAIGQGFPTRNLTWNVMSIGTGNNQNFMAQVAYGGRVYTSQASNNVQNNCSVSGGFTTCGISGSIEILGHNVTWSGTHTYSTSSNQAACSEVSGTWSSTTFGPGAMGTFVSDSDCVGTTVQNDTCENAISIAVGGSASGSTVDATMTDAPPSCVTGFNNAPGVWYTFVGTGFPVEINTLGSTLSTKLGLFLGSCGALICEDGDESGGIGNTSLIPKDTVLDEVYYIYVSSTDDNMTGDFVVNITGPDSFTNANCDESIQDQGGNGNYEGNRTDVYVIDAGEGNIANLFFSEFDTEEGFDFLQIHDGPDTNSPEITMTVEGNSADAQGYSGTGGATTSLFQQNVISSGRYLTVVFRTDPNVVGTGFTADITCMMGRQVMGSQQTSRTYKPALRIMPKK